MNMVPVRTWGQGPLNLGIYRMFLQNWENLTGWDIQIFVMNMTFISSSEVKKYIFHE